MDIRGLRHCTVPSLRYQYEARSHRTPFRIKELGHVSADGDWQADGDCSCAVHEALSVIFWHR